MQCSLNYNFEIHKWKCSPKNKIPKNAKDIFESLIINKNIFNNKIPPFLLKNLTYQEWIKIKSSINDFNDIYLDCPNNTIKELYKEKGCYYIQISDKGLYHLGNDICKFNVPEFICSQHLRIRIKVHTTSTSKGFCQLSVMISCLPKNINLLINSPFSLDNIKKLPINLHYRN